MALSVQSEMKQLSPVERELSVVVPGAEVAKELDRAYRELGQKVRLKGFRQGKVPRYVLEQYYKRETEQQVLERLLGNSFREAVKTHELQPVANPTIQSVPELIAGMDFRYMAKVEVKPVIDIQSYEGLALTRKRYKATDADVEKELSQLRDQHARIVPVEGRTKTQQGDLVEINWSGTVNGETVKGMSGIGQVVEVGAGAFPYKEVDQALVGKNKGEQLTVESKLPDDFRIESLRGQTATLTVQVIELKQKTLPALDDEFAKDVDEEVDSLAALRTKIKDRLEKLATSRTTAELRDGAVQALIEKNPFDVPQALIDQQAEQIAVDRLSRLPQQTAEMIWQQQGPRMKEDARPTAMKQVRASLVLEALVKKEGLQVTDDDLEAHYKKVADELNTKVSTVRDVYKRGRRADELRFQLAGERMLDRVLEKAKFTDVEASLDG